MWQKWLTIPTSALFNVFFFIISFFFCICVSLKNDVFPQCIHIWFPPPWTRGGRPITTISRLSYILFIFSSEPPRNPCPSNTIVLNVQPFQIRIFLKIFLFARVGHSKKIILQGRFFWGGSDKKLRRMWLGREIIVVYLPPLAPWTTISRKNIKTMRLSNWPNQHISI